MKVALLSAAVATTNAGDAFIDSAIQRMLSGYEFQRFSLRVPSQEIDFEGMNACDLALISGTNLYQQSFHCNLTAEAVGRISIPIIPVGVGSSAPIGKIPAMNAAGVEAVRAIHKKCIVSSVRDEGSLRFLQSIGIKNAMVTGCPVLFHALGCPDFSQPANGYTLTPRARLLHIEEEWSARQLWTLEMLCRKFHPTLVLQSPYDLEIAEPLAKKFGLAIIYGDAGQTDLFLKAAKDQAANFGFRLHFGMLSISYGRPAYFVAHDSRVAEFVKLLSLPLLDITNYSDMALIHQIESNSFDTETVRRRWDELAHQMNEFFSIHGLNSRLVSDVPRKGIVIQKKPERRKKIRILMLIDKRNWAFDISARWIGRVLKKDFDFDFKYIREGPILDPSRYDLVYVFFWGESYHHQFGFKKQQIMKELSSHRWQDNPNYGPVTPAELVEKYLNDCDTVLCTSLRLVDQFTPLHPRVRHIPNGVSSYFKPRGKRTGPMTIGWAGDAGEDIPGIPNYQRYKGFQDIVEPACQNRFRLLAALGNVRHKKMNKFFNKIDVYVVAASHEGEPLTLLEAMAAGCFPVCTDVGIVPEVIQHQVNGYIVSERTPEAFIEAFSWCEANLERIRKAGEENAVVMKRERNWELCAQYFKRIFLEAYQTRERRL